MKENTLIKATKLLLDIMFFAGFAVIVTLPVSVRIYGYINSYPIKSFGGRAAGSGRDRDGYEVCQRNIQGDHPGKH